MKLLLTEDDIRMIIHDYVTKELKLSIAKSNFDAFDNEYMYEAELNKK